MHQLEKQQFQQLSRWRRFVQTGDVTCIRHFRDLFGFMEFNAYVLSSNNDRQDLVFPTTATLLDHLSPGINRVAAELFIPGVVVSLVSAESSLHAGGVQASCRLRIDRGPAGTETTAGWRSLYFGKEVAALLAKPELTYDHWMQNIIFRCMTKHYRSQAHGTADERVRASLKPEYYPAYNTFVKRYSQSGSGMPWEM